MHNIFACLFCEILTSGAFIFVFYTFAFFILSIMFFHCCPVNSTLSSWVQRSGSEGSWILIIRCL